VGLCASGYEKFSVVLRGFHSLAISGEVEKLMEQLADLENSH